jgi:hypothetical protein
VFAITTQKGQSAEDVAREKGHRAAVLFLQHPDWPLSKVFENVKR